MRFAATIILLVASGCGGGGGEVAGEPVPSDGGAQGDVHAIAPGDDGTANALDSASATEDSTLALADSSADTHALADGSNADAGPPLTFTPPSDCVAITAPLAPPPDGGIVDGALGDGGFRSASPMPTPKDVRVQLPLTTGRVLVVADEIEEFDPVADRWTSHGRLPIPTERATAGAILADGRPLVTTGASAYVYDATFHVFSKTAPLLSPRAPVLTRLPDGAIVASGNSAFEPSSRVERFDPKTETWSALAEMHRARLGHVTIALSDGRLLVIGGGVDEPEIYVPTAGAWMLMPKSPFTGAWSRPAAALLPSGEILVGGRIDYASKYSPSLMDGPMPFARFDPRCGTWRPARWLPFSMHSASALALPSGRVLIAGGHGVSHSAWPAAAIATYDPTLDDWQVFPAGDVAGSPQGLSLAAGPRVVVTGGPYTCGKMCWGRSTKVGVFESPLP